MRRALTLVELMLAITIVGLSMLPLIGLFSAASDHAHTTADHTLSLALSNKIAEELRAASLENRYFAASVDADRHFGGQQPIADDGSPFFRGIEDSALPAGRIRPGEDTGIVGSLGPLHRMLLNHRLLVEGSPAESANGDMIDISIRFDWSGGRDRSRRSRFDLRLPRLDTVLLSPDFDMDAADQLVAQTLYGPDAAGTLTQIAAARGADLDLVRALGQVAIVSTSLETGETGHQALVGRLEREAATSTSDADRAHALVDLGRVLENRAALRIRAADYLGPALERLAAGFTPAALGQPPPAAPAYCEPARLLVFLPLDFDWDLDGAIGAYRLAVALPANAMPMRALNAFLERALTLARLMAVTTGPEDPTLARAIAQEIVKLNEGRNPNRVAFAKAELDSCRDAATLRASYRPESRLTAWDRYVGNVIRASTAALSGGRPAGRRRARERGQPGCGPGEAGEPRAPGPVRGRCRRTLRVRARGGAVKRRGFTVVEALIAVALCAAFIGVLVMLLIHSGRSSARAGTQHALQQMGRTALARLLQELQECMEVVLPTPGSTLPHAVVRDQVSCARWYFQVPQPRRPGEPELYELWRYRADPDVPAAERSERVLGNIRRLTFTPRGEAVLQVNLLVREHGEEFPLLTSVRLRNAAGADDDW